MSLARVSKDWAKRLSASVLYHSGILRLLAGRRLEGKAVVLMYHRVLPEAEARRSFSHPGMVVTPETFRRHLDFLKAQFHPMTLREFADHLDAKRPFPKGACLVTFDDGWIDNHDHALPLLRQRGMPAAVFVATDYIESDQAFWQEQLGHLLFQASRHGVGESVLRAHGIGPDVAGDEEHLRTSITAIVQQYRGESYEVVAGLLSELREALDAAGHAESITPGDRFMSWAQLETLAASGIEIASHTCSHRLLTRLDEAAVREEFAASRTEINARLGQDTVALAYPGGHYDVTARLAAAECGYRLAFTTDKKAASADGDPLLIPRINIHETGAQTGPLLFCRMLGLF